MIDKPVQLSRFAQLPIHSTTKLWQFQLHGQPDVQVLRMHGFYNCLPIHDSRSRFHYEPYLPADL